MLVMGSDDGDGELVSWGLGNVAQSRDSAERKREDLFDLRATSSCYEAVGQLMDHDARACGRGSG